MKLASVSNNYGESFDGVGAFAQVQNSNFPSYINVTVYSAVCSNESSFAKRFLCMNMTKEIFKVFRDFEREKYDVVMIEYPFVEWNPLILIPILFLKIKLKKYNKILCLSLHEYQRVNRLRKIVIRQLGRIADVTLVANEEMCNDVKKYCKSCEIRGIPTNIYSKEIVISSDRNKNNYVFFGLVNKVKAFQEMLSAWDEFNSNLKCRLFIISSSKLNNIESLHKNVTYIYNADNSKILNVMQKCAFCIIPVKPDVDMKNTTFKTGCICGCVCIGKFCEEFKALPVINMDNYSQEEFIKAFEISSQMPDDELENKSQQAKEYGIRYTPAKTSEITAEILNRYIGVN